MASKDDLQESLLSEDTSYAADDVEYAGEEVPLHDIGDEGGSSSKSRRRRKRSSKSSENADWERHFVLDGSDGANAFVRKFRQVFRRKGVRFYYTLYFVWTLLFASVYIALYSQHSDDTADEKSKGGFCGRDGFDPLQPNKKFLNYCFIDFLLGYPQEFTLLSVLALWIVAFNPFAAPRRPSLTLGSGKQFVLYVIKLVAALLVTLIPDPRTVNALFHFSPKEEVHISGSIVFSDVLRSITWLSIFVMLIVCYLKQVQIPTLIRQFSFGYFIYRLLWMVWVITSEDENDGRLYFETTSLISSFLVNLLLILAIRFPSLEPSEGAIPKLEKSKDNLHWPSLRETWDLLGCTKARVTGVFVIFFAVFEGVVRVITFKELGRALVACPPALATCISYSTFTGPQYHTYRGYDINRLVPLIAYAFSVNFLRGIGRTCNVYLFEATTNRLKDRLFGSSLDATRYYVAQHKSHLSQIIHYYLDREFLKTLLRKFPEAIVPVVQIITSVIILFQISWQISVLVASIIIVFAMFSVWRNFYTGMYMKRYLASRDRERNLTEDVFNGFEAVQLYAMEQHERHRLRQVITQTIHHARHLYFVDIMSDVTEAQILTAAVICGIAYGATLTGTTNLISPVELAMYGTVSFNVNSSVRTLTQFVTELGKSRYAADRALSLMECPEPANLDELPAPATDFDLDIKLENVYFAYTRPDNPEDNTDYKLRNVSLEIPQGHSVGLVGHTGCGKSTLIKLLLKENTIAPGEGSLTVGGRPIETVCTRWLYSKICYVPQKPVIFDESVYYNLVYGWPRAENAPHPDKLAAADREHLFKLIRDVRLDEILEPGLNGEKYIMLEKKASDMSGGQQQRIGIIRALLRKPKLMLLDEITSALDGSTEAQVMSLIRDCARENNATCIMIAHKYRTIENVDELFVMSEGKVVERGTYQELSQKQGGEFYNLLKSS